MRQHTRVLVRHSYISSSVFNLLLNTHCIKYEPTVYAVCVKKISNYSFLFLSIVQYYTCQNWWNKWVMNVTIAKQSGKNTLFREFCYISRYHLKTHLYHAPNLNCHKSFYIGWLKVNSDPTSLDVEGAFPYHLYLYSCLFVSPLVQVQFWIFFATIDLLSHLIFFIRLIAK